MEIYIVYVLGKNDYQDGTLYGVFSSFENIVKERKDIRTYLRDALKNEKNESYHYIYSDAFMLEKRILDDSSTMIEKSYWIWSYDTNEYVIDKHYS